MTGAAGGGGARAGILWMLLGVLLYMCADTIVKELSKGYPVVQIVWARYAFHLALVVLVVGRRLPRVMRTERPGLHAVRSILQLGAAATFITALGFIGLVEANAIQFAAPLIVTALSVPLLGEPVGIRRWLGVAVGFIGVLVIIRPGTEMMAWASFLPLAAAGFSAFYQIITRVVGRTDDAMTSLVYAGLAGGVVSSAIVPFYWVAPDAYGWLLLVGLGTLAGASNFAVIKALQAAPAATVTPYAYSSLIWATLFGYVFFDNLPDLWTVAGALIIVGSGLYIYYRESVRRREGPGWRDMVGEPGPRGRPVHGILWMTLAMLVLVVNDTISKYLVQSLPAIEVVCGRYTVHVLLLVLLFGRRLPRAMVTQRHGLHVLRACAVLLSAWLVVVALDTVPLADVIAVLFLSPIFIALLSVPLLGESVGLRRWLGVIVGFAGALLVIRPGSDVFQLATLLPLVSALFSGLFQIATRYLSRTEGLLTTLAYTALIAALVSGAALPFVWVTPDAETWLMIAAMGTASGAGHFCMFKALQAAPVATVAPFNYTTLIWATLFGFLVFGDLPGGWSVLGMAVIAISGIFVFSGEMRRRAAALPEVLWTRLGTRRRRVWRGELRWGDGP